MIEFGIFEISFPYFNNGNLFHAKVLAERQATGKLFHIIPTNLIDFYRFDLLLQHDGTFKTCSEYTMQKEFYSSVCQAIMTYINASPLS